MHEEPQGAEKPKIIIDEDWKSQAQAEKEALARERGEPTTPAKETSAGNEVEKGAAPAVDAFPPASLSALVTMLATQAMLAMGQGANPLTGQVEVQLDFAKYLIDTLTVLEEKTQGNRTPQEIAMLSSVLHELRMAYVAVSKGGE